MKISFNDLPLGPYTEVDLAKQWPGVSLNRGVSEGRCTIVELDDENVLCVTLQKDQIGPIDGGISWRYYFEEPADSYVAEYKVRVSEEFDYVRGGKLPGLCGGTSPGGGADTSKADGFSARVMWRELGVLENYLYTADKQADKKWGSDYLWLKSCNQGELFDEWETLAEATTNRTYLTSDVWHTIKTTVTLNTPGREDGRVVTYFDEMKVLDMPVHFRNDDSFSIDSFRFTTFFGGNNSTWAPNKNEKIYFKDFEFIRNI